MTNHHQTTPRRRAGVTPKNNRTHRQPSVRYRRVASPGPEGLRRGTSPPRPAHHRWWWTTGSIATVVLVALVLVALAIGSGSSPGVSPQHTGGGRALGSGAVPVPDALQDAVSSVDPGTLRTVGEPAGLSGPTKVTGDHAALVGIDGKPEVLYVGAEYCPFCAAERWALVVALSQFGSFTGLKETHSSSSDVYPDTPTLSFYGSTFASTDLDFTSVELATNQAVRGQYRILEKFELGTAIRARRLRPASLHVAGGCDPLHRRGQPVRRDRRQLRPRGPPGKVRDPDRAGALAPVVPRGPSRRRDGESPRRRHLTRHRGATEPMTNLPPPGPRR